MRSEVSKLLILTFVALMKHIDMTIAGESKCEICKSVVDKFDEGLKKTSKSNFGGGNSNWEESRLGSFKYSETRLVEVMENLCSDGDKMCHIFLEANEELVEKYFFAVYAKNLQEDNPMKKWLCIKNVKVCCPDNMYGPECSSCPGDTKTPCNGHGDCDGAGTRQGTGKCNCHDGYKGDLCDVCADGYFEETEENDENKTKCTACHESCQSTCWEAGPKGCDECKKGWTQVEGEGCKDIDECTENPTCGADQYCTNTQGSYFCASCHKACKHCTEYGEDKCSSCNEGYRMENESCKDIDECAEDEANTICPGEHRQCANSPGSFSCDCEKGYTEEDGQCLKEQPKPPKPKSSSKGKRSKKKQKPSLSVLGIVIFVFGLLGRLFKGNVPIVFALGVAFFAYLYWFASEFEKF